MNRSNSAHGGRWGWRTLLALAALVAGVAVIVVAVLAQSDPAQPPKAVGEIDPSPTSTLSTNPGSTSSPSPGSAKSTPKQDASKQDASKQEESSDPLGFSKPVRISIPKIHVKSEVFPIGKNKDGQLAVPQPGPNLNKTAWYKNSATPGQPGPSIIEGHVDTAEQGRSVFYDLADLRPGDKVKVDRKDGLRVTYTVNAVRDFAKDKFPTKLVYGGKNLGTPTLRLITCSDFDPDLGTHVGNAVVFSSVTSVHKIR